MALFLALGSFGAGLLGALTGLGGGLVVVPMMTLLFHIDLRYAIGASLVSVIATSSGAAAAYVREGFTNVRVGIFLEVATTVGALSGAALAGFIPTSALAVLFGLVLLYTAYRSLRAPEEHPTDLPSDPLALRLRLNSTYPTAAGIRAYSVQGVKKGFALMFVAGVLSALLGIGSGIVKVLAMDHTMKLPFKVSTTTSNFMIGVTAAASAGVYLHRGYIEPALAFPVMLGVLAGALLGARILAGAKTLWLRRIFTTVVVVLALEMLYKGLRGGL
ncbi:MAG TPA: sulfite exporter TauE/SafE family protein [Gemmatimonadaceae bacterium]